MRSEDIRNPFATSILVGAMQTFSRSTLAFLLMLPIFLPLILIALVIEFITPFIRCSAERLGEAIGHGIASLFHRPSRPTFSLPPQADIQTYDPPPPTTMPDDSTIKLLGIITWLYAQKSQFNSYKITRAISRPPTEIVIECDCGDSHEPFPYTITLRCMSDGTFQGDFVGGAGRDKSIGTVAGRFYQSSSGYAIIGTWLEGGEKSEIIAELLPVTQFPDEGPIQP